MELLPHNYYNVFRLHYCYMIDLQRYEIPQFYSKTQEAEKITYRELYLMVKL